MQIINVFGVGKPTYSKKGKVNFHSEMIDRRRKENSAYRNSKVRKGKLKKEKDGIYIVFENGVKVRTDYEW